MAPTAWLAITLAVLSFVVSFAALAILGRLSYVVYLRRVRRREGTCTCTCDICGPTRIATRRKRKVPGTHQRNISEQDWSAESEGRGEHEEEGRLLKPGPASRGGSREGSPARGEEALTDNDNFIEMQDLGDRIEERLPSEKDSKDYKDECCWVEGERGHCGVGRRGQKQRWWSLPGRAERRGTSRTWLSAT